MYYLDKSYPKLKYTLGVSSHLVLRYVFSDPIISGQFKCFTVYAGY